MPTYVDRDEVLRSIVERVVRRSLPDPEQLETAERDAITAHAERASLTFIAAHALRRTAARATLGPAASLSPRIPCVRWFGGQTTS